VIKEDIGVTPANAVFILVIKISCAQENSTTKWAELGHTMPDWLPETCARKRLICTVYQILRIETIARQKANVLLHIQTTGADDHTRIHTCI